MREIKFRAWDKEDKKMIYGIQDASQFKDKISFITGPNPFNYFLKHGSFETMQYTGLKDKNGKEIYEGDIAEWQLKENRGKIVFEKGQFEIQTEPYSWNLFSALNYELEIIGNIYENKEVLK